MASNMASVSRNVRSWGRAAVCFLLVTAALISSPSPSHAEDSAVVATVNGAPITESELEEMIEQVAARNVYHARVTEDVREEFKDKALEALISAELQYQDAVARGMKPDRGRVREQMRKIRDSFSSKWNYNIWLQKKDLTEEQLEKRVERAVLVQNVISEIAEKPVRVSEETVRLRYDAEKERFREPEQLRLRILSAKSRETVEKALEAAQGGEDFASVAKRLSEDAYRDKGGDIGNIRRGVIFPQLETAAFGMKKGEVSPPIHAEGKWFLVKVDNIFPEHILSFDEVRDSLKKEIEQKQMKELFDRWMDDLRAKATIVAVPVQEEQQ